MNEPQTEPPSVPTIHSVIAVAVGLALAGTIFTVHKVVLSARVNKAYAEIREKGFPLTLEDLEESYAIPVGDNGADFVIEGIKNSWYPNERLTLVNGFSLNTKFFPGDHLPPALFRQLERVVENNDTLYSYLLRASQADESRYRMVRFQGIENDRPMHTLRLRYAVMFMLLKSTYQLHDGQPDHAARSVVTAFGVAQTLANEPSLLAQRGRIDTLNEVVRGLEWVMQHPLTDTALLRELIDVMEEAARSEPITRAYAGVRCVGPWFRELPTKNQWRYLRSPTSTNRRAYGFDVGRIPFKERMYGPLGLLDMDLLYFLDIMQKLIDLTRAPSEGRIAKFIDVLDEIGETPKRHIGSANYLPRIPHAIVQHIGLQTQIRVAQVALSIELYRTEFEGLPDDLRVLQDAYPHVRTDDPLSGAPLFFHRLDEGYVVYSEGLTVWGDMQMPSGMSRIAGSYKSFMRPLNYRGEMADGRRAIYFRVSH